MHFLAAYVKEGIRFAQNLSLENSVDSYLCFQLAYFTQSLNSFSFIDHLLPLCAQFLILFHFIIYDLILSTNLSPNVFGDFNVHHKIGLLILVELIDLVNFVIISKDLTQMVNFPTRIPYCGSHSPALLDLLISSDASIWSTIAFHPLENYDHVVVWFSIDFSSY